MKRREQTCDEFFTETIAVVLTVARAICSCRRWFLAGVIAATFPFTRLGFSRNVVYWSPKVVFETQKTKVSAFFDTKVFLGDKKAFLGMEQFKGQKRQGCRSTIGDLKAVAEAAQAAASCTNSSTNITKQHHNMKKTPKGSAKAAKEAPIAGTAAAQT